MQSSSAIFFPLLFHAQFSNHFHLFLYFVTLSLVFVHVLQSADLHVSNKLKRNLTAGQSVYTEACYGLCLLVVGKVEGLVDIECLEWLWKNVQRKIEFSWL